MATTMPQNGSFFSWYQKRLYYRYIPRFFVHPRHRHTRAIPLLPPSLTISCFPQPSSPELIPTLSHVLAELLPQHLLIPLSLDLLNKTPFLPESKEEDLHSGYLQLPPGTTILLTESAIREGKLLERGMRTAFNCIS